MRFFLTVILGMAAIFAAILFYDAYKFNSTLSSAQKSDSSSIVLGDPNGTLTVVEFFDYNCPFCPEIHRNLVEAVMAEKNTKLIIRPIGWVSAESEQIAHFMIAVGLQGKLPQLHARILDAPTPPSLIAIKAMAQIEGVDINKAETVMKNVANTTLFGMGNIFMDQLGFSQIPAIMIGKTRFTPSDSLPTVNQFRLMIDAAKH